MNQSVEIHGLKHHAGQLALLFDLANLERIGAIPKQTTAGERLSQTAIEAAAQYWKVTEMDLPVQGVLFDRLVMQ